MPCRGSVSWWLDTGPRGRVCACPKGVLGNGAPAVPRTPAQTAFPLANHIHVTFV